MPKNDLEVLKESVLHSFKTLLKKLRVMRS